MIQCMVSLSPASQVFQLQGKDTIRAPPWKPRRWHYLEEANLWPQQQQQQKPGHFWGKFRTAFRKSIEIPGFWCRKDRKVQILKGGTSRIFQDFCWFLASLFCSKIDDSSAAIYWFFIPICWTTFWEFGPDWICLEMLLCHFRWFQFITPLFGGFH